MLPLSKRCLPARFLSLPLLLALTLAAHRQHKRRVQQRVVAVQHKVAAGARGNDLRLSGWSSKRRVIVMRRQLKMDAVLERKSNNKSKGKNAQVELHFIDENEPIKSWEYAVLVSNAAYGLAQIGQLYRDRADCENGFDEIKNQWGWGGYSTQDIERCALSARAVALIYNWWSWYVRLANPKNRLEAKTSRPKLLKQR